MKLILLAIPLFTASCSLLVGSPTTNAQNGAPSAVAVPIIEVVGTRSSSQPLNAYQQHLVSAATEDLHWLEEYTGRRFKSSPTLHLPDLEEWMSIIDAEYSNGRDRAIAYEMTLVIFQLEPRRVALAPGMWLDLEDEDESEIDELELGNARLSIVGMLTALLDEEHFGLTSAARATTSRSEKDARLYLIKGHIALVEGTWAEQHGAPWYFQDWYGEQPESREFVGRNYLKRVFNTGGAAAVDDVLRGPLPALRDIRVEGATNPDPKSGAEVLMELFDF